MIRAKSVTVPKNTVAATPLVEPWQITQGLFYKLDIFFPPGPSGLVGIALRTGLHQIYPFDSDEWFIGDNVPISFDDEYMFDIASGQIEIAAYNLDDYYDHTIYVRLGIITDPELIKARFGYSSIEALTIQLQALNTLLAMQNVASGRFSTEALAKL